MSKKILVANRGEIACRIIRSIQKAGHIAVAVYSEADKNARFVSLADESVALGGNTAADSYLNIEKVVNAAMASCCEAVHPGYGFLSENPLFAKRLHEANIKFIGPSVLAIEVMGNKAAAKALMIEAGVPCIPGYQGSAQDVATLEQEAKNIGYPLMIKAAAGGGGRGIRMVADAKQLAMQVASAQKEALSAFGSDEVILEKALLDARHIEIQVFADQQGSVIHLAERDCSVQRRHQKVIEEAPSPFMTEELRKAMGEAAVNAAKAVNYEGAGTVEFLVDSERNFYFLEMNTRLQVEHPVTEMITGYDLVDWQLQIAEGKPLPVTQADVELEGHAIEVRLYAEDAAAGFIPQTGCLQQFQLAQGEGVRIDHGFEAGAVISPYYDAMLAKIICWGKDREQARTRVLKAIRDTKITGLKTNKNFVYSLLNEAAFVSGNATTAFIDDALLEQLKTDYEQKDLALSMVLLEALQAKTFGELSSWSNSEGFVRREQFQVGGQAESVLTMTCVKHKLSNRYEVRFIDNATQHEAIYFDEVKIEGACINWLHQGVSKQAVFSFENNLISFDLGERTLALTRITYEPAKSADAKGSGKILSSTEGLLVEVLVSEGQAVKKGDVLIIVEAMKMEHRHVADIDGTVAAINASAGKQVKARELLLEIVAHTEGSES